MPDQLRELLQSLVQRRAAYRDFTQSRIPAMFREHDRKPPPDFENSSFLYMRSYDGDIGERPFSGTPHWRSPDLLLRPMTGTGTYTTSLDAGQTYRVECVLRNRGDLGVPSAKVELFLTDPTIGFDTTFATNLTLGQVPTAWVGAGASAVATFPYSVPPTESGHKCLFARTFSFSPLELPVEDYGLNPRIDRHVAQQNLNIAGPGDAFRFHLVHLPNAVHRIELAPLEPDELRALRHPVLGDVTPAEDFPRRGWARLAQVHLAEATGRVEVDADTEGLHLRITDPDGTGLDEQREVRKRVHEVLEQVHAGHTRTSEHRDLFARFRQMNADARRATFDMTVPDVRLRPGQAIALDIRGRDEGTGDGEVMGGITLVIVGR